MKHAIEEFSSIFAFGHSAASSTEEGDLCYEISSCQDFEYDEIFEAVQILGLKHQESFFETAIEIMKKKEIFASKKKFMSFVLSRCMKLSETPTLFNFLVLCAFVDNIVFGLCNDEECFKVIKMASKILTAAFYRRYVDLFDKENGFKGFSKYCEKLNATVLNPCEDSEPDSDDSLDLEGFIPPDTDDLIDLLKSFSEIDDDSEFMLNDFEIKLLYERDGDEPLDIDPAEDIFIPLDDGSEAINILKLDVEDLNIKSKKVLERLIHRCPMCEENCYKHVVLVAKELEVCEI